MTTTQLVSYVQAHSFPAWDVQTVPANLIDVQSLISR
jgi:hypothetical protein